MKRGKKYVEAAKNIDRQTLYEAADAISLVKKNACAYHLLCGIIDGDALLPEKFLNSIETVGLLLSVEINHCI